MAVKQNNTEPNGSPSSVNGGANANNTNGSMTNIQGEYTNAVNQQLDGGGSNGEQADCSGSDSTASTCAPGSINTSNVSPGMNNLPAKHDIAYILHLIDLIEMKQQNVILKQDMLKIYQHLIVELARVQIPRNSPDELKRFKEDIAKVGAFFKKTNEKGLYLFFLGVVCQLITQGKGEFPSCAIAIIFQLFNEEMVCEAVNSLLDQKVPNQNIKKTVRLLCEWLRMVNFCQNLNQWIVAILNGLQEQQKLALFYEIALENIEHLFASLIVPVLRPNVAPIVFQMLSSVNHTPQIFHKIIPRLPKVVALLQKQQQNKPGEQAEETKKFLQQLVDIVSSLMIRFYGYDDLYQPIEIALRDFQPSYNYMNFTNGYKVGDDNGSANDDISQNSNVKVGLVNLGNTCYMNSVLQALAMTKEFSREILLSPCKSPLLLKMQEQIALMLYSMRYELTPSRVLNATRPPGFSPGLQQDSSEFLGYLLETLHEQEVSYTKRITSVSDNDAIQIAQTAKETDDLNDTIICTEGASAISQEQLRNVKPNVTGSIVSYSSIAENKEKFMNAANNQKNHNMSSTSFASTVSTLSTIDKTFTGKLSTTYKCLTCSWKSCNIDSFRDLQLSFPEVKNECASNYSVQDLIDYYCSPEKLDGDNQYFCEKCKKLTDAERYISIISAPKNLILTLKQFKYDQKYHMRAKLLHKVFHDEKVSVKICAADSLEEVACVHYDLYAGVIHSGFSMDSGHYYTYAADAYNQWYKFNDNIVTSSKSEELHNLTPPNTPYILFYQMSSRSNEHFDAQASTKVIKVDVPNPLSIEELPHDLRDYINHDNCAFTEELKLRRYRNEVPMHVISKNKANGFKGARDDEDDDDQPPPTGGCGGNAMNINVNRFVY